MHHLKSFVNLRRWEKMSIDSMTQNIKLSLCQWLISPSAKASRKSRHPPQQLYFKKFLQWLMKDIVVTVIKSFFYVTEHQNHRNHVFFYRKKLWQHLQAAAVNQQTGQMFSPISKNEFDEMFLQNKTFGSSRLRFLPKATGVRPIINLRATAKHGFCFRETPRSINRHLQDVFCVLNYEKVKRPELCGSTCFGYHHIHERLKSFILHQKRSGSHGDRLDPLMVANFDLKNCYDSILPRKLMDILTQRVLKRDKYLLRRYASVYITAGKIRRFFHREATVAGELVPFSEFAMNMSKKSRNCIFIDQVMYPVIRRQKVLEVLRKHLFGNVVQMGKQHFLQKQGISQGSNLSSILCGIYYADMERNCLPKLHPHNDLLMRFVDDFLLVTGNPATAASIICTLERGVVDYNCSINKDKGGANFKLDEHGQVWLDREVKWLEWCGLVISPYSLDVRVDYSRYKLADIRDNMTVSLHSKPLQGFLFFMQRCVQLRCLPVFLDSDMLSFKCILVNIYQTFLMGALKFLAYVSALPIWSRAVNHRPVRLKKKLILHLYGLALHCTAYFWQLGQTKCTSVHSHLTSSFTVPRPMCTWLGCHAFKTVLSHHEPARLSLLVRIFSCKLETISNTLGPDLLKQCFRAIRTSSNDIMFSVNMNSL